MLLSNANGLKQIALQLRLCCKAIQCVSGSAFPICRRRWQRIWRVALQASEPLSRADSASNANCEMIISPPVDIIVIITNSSQNTLLRSIAFGATSPELMRPWPAMARPAWMSAVACFLSGLAPIATYSLRRRCASVSAGPSNHSRRIFPSFSPEIGFGGMNARPNALFPTSLQP
jgi:hypothetical protein